MNEKIKFIKRHMELLTVDDITQLYARTNILLFQKKFGVYPYHPFFGRHSAGENVIEPLVGIHQNEKRYNQFLQENGIFKSDFLRIIKFNDLLKTINWVEVNKYWITEYSPEIIRQMIAFISDLKGEEIPPYDGSELFADRKIGVIKFHKQVKAGYCSSGILSTTVNQVLDKTIKKLSEKAKHRFRLPNRDFDWKPGIVGIDQENL